MRPVFLLWDNCYDAQKTEHSLDDYCASHILCDIATAGTRG